jgi:type IV secretory pathway TraG/TraD family ATPase VirD4
MILAAKIQIAALRRATLPVEQRKQFFFIVDEFQSFVSSASSFSYTSSERSFSSLLSEARKYGLGLVLANQYISQLDQGTVQAVFGNTGSQIAFRVSRDDAELLARHFSLGELTVEDFQNCPNFHGYAHLLIDGTPHLPFTIRTIAPERIQRNPLAAEAIRSQRVARFRRA